MHELNQSEVLACSVCSVSYAPRLRELFRWHAIGVALAITCWVIADRGLFRNASPQRTLIDA